MSHLNLWTGSLVNQMDAGNPTDYIQDPLQQKAVEVSYQSHERVHPAVLSRRERLGNGLSSL